MRWPRTALAPTLALSAFALLVFLSAASAVLATTHPQNTDGDSDIIGGRYQYRWTIYDVDPGDRISLSLAMNSDIMSVLDHVRFFVVEGGEGDEMAAGRPATILHEGRHPGFRFTMERPEIPLDKAHARGLNGDLHDAIDVVFLLDRPDSMGDDDFRFLAAGVEHALLQSRATVARAFWVDVQPVLYTGMAVAAMVAVATTGSWLRGHREASVPEARSLEGLAQVHAAAAGFLRSLRDTLRVAGAVLMLAGVGLLAAMGSLLAEVRYEPGAGWQEAMLVLTLLSAMAAVILWAVQYRRVAREARRWDAARSPLDA